MSQRSPSRVRINAEERVVLERVAADESSVHGKRARIILNSADGLPVDHNAADVGLSVRTVRKWLRAFNEQRLGIFPDDALTDKSHESAGTETLAPGRISLMELCRRYRVDMAHARHVGGLAAVLFELTQPIHKLHNRYVQVIYTAGVLHNVAYAGGRAKHHTRGREIILQNPLSDVEDADRELIAVTTAFHRKSWKSKRLSKEPGYIALSPQRQRIALILAALVRIADGLDYTQSQTTVLARSEAGPEGVQINVIGPFVEVDADRADHKADLWRAIMDVPLRVTPYQDNSFTSLVQPIEKPEEIESAPLQESPGVLPDDLMSEAGRKLLGFHFQRMLHHEPGTRAGEDPEELHDMRVATRRMRAAFQVFGKHYEKTMRKRLLKGLKRTGRALGRVRDLDVFMQNAQLYLADLPDERQVDLDMLAMLWAEQRKDARQNMLSYLDGQPYRDFVEEFNTFVSSPGMASRDVDAEAPAPVLLRHIAPRLVYKRYEKVRAYGSVLSRANIELLHQLRIDIKRLRYTLEFFREALGDEAAGVIKTLVALQDHLGALHDADVAQQLIGDEMARMVKQARKEARKHGEDPDMVDLSHLKGMVIYRENQERRMLELRDALPEVWQQVEAAETRRKLALAISVL